MIRNISTPPDIYEVISEFFIKQLAHGKIPWHSSWKEHPRDARGQAFQGMNIWLLATLGYPRNVFLTKRDIVRFNAWVNKREKGHRIIVSREWFGRQWVEYLEVYNLAQLHGIDESAFPAPKQWNALNICAEIVGGMDQLPTIKEYESTVFYSYNDDTIYMPPRESLGHYTHYFSTLFYALLQATGHPKRCNRESCTHRNELDEKLYSLEELIVEMGCALLCSYAGIEPWYLINYHPGSERWLEKIKEDTMFISSAALYADQAVQYILKDNRRAIGRLQ